MFGKVIDLQGDGLTLNIQVKIALRVCNVSFRTTKIARFLIAIQHFILDSSANNSDRVAPVTASQA